MISVVLCIDGEVQHEWTPFDILPNNGHRVVWHGRNYIVTAVVHQLDSAYIQVDLETVIG